MRFMRREEKNEDSFDDDPMSAVGNLFDVALVFIVALLFALMAMFGKELFDGQSRVRVDSSGRIEILTKKGRKIESLKQSNETAEGKGVRLGTAYRLEDGTTVYVPEECVFSFSFRCSCFCSPQFSFPEVKNLCSF